MGGDTHRPDRGFARGSSLPGGIFHRSGRRFTAGKPQFLAGSFDWRFPRFYRRVYHHLSAAKPQSPEHLQSSVTLMIMTGIFVLANMLQSEAGLLAVTVMGIDLANQQKTDIKKSWSLKRRWAVWCWVCLYHIDRPFTYRGSLQSGKTRVSVPGGTHFVAVPCRFYLNHREQFEMVRKNLPVFHRPRGVVAVSVTSLFALRLQEQHLIGAGNLVTITFMVVIGTVLFYSIIAMPLAKRLGLAQPNPQGILIVGAHHWARMIAGVLQKEGFPVTLIDTNPTAIKRARDNGLNAKRENILSADIEERIDFNSLGKVLALTPNDETNSLVALNFTDLMGKANLYQLPLRSHYEVPLSLRGRILFNQYANYDYLEKLADAGAVIKEVSLTEESDCQSFNKGQVKKRFPCLPLTKTRN